MRVDGFVRGAEQDWTVRLVAHLQVLFLALAVLIQVGCVAQSAGPPPESDSDRLLAAYRNAVFASAIFDSANVHSLFAIPRGVDSVTVVTWTAAQTAERFYPLGETRIGVDVWVTLVPEVQDRCAAYPTNPSALTLRLQQLLGLPPHPEERVFVVMVAAVKDVFRPCPDPDPTKEQCGRSLPQRVDPEYEAWVAHQMLDRYQTPPQGFPWTRLGYTYDWNPDSNKFGASEYVIRKGSKVVVTAKVETPSYCHQK